MRTVPQSLKLTELAYPIDMIAPIDDCLFFDIETTGFTARNCDLYLIGCAYHNDEGWQLIQWFANKPSEQAEIIAAFFNFASSFSHLIHFNGSNFDIPFIEQKCEQLHLNYSFEHLKGVDLYKRLAPYKNFLGLDNMKQKSIEAFLGITREDKYTGGELINVYQRFVEDPTVEDLEILLLHNADDVRGLLEILPILSYYDLFNRPLKAKKVQANSYQDYYGATRQELLMRLSLPVSVPVPVKAHANSCVVSIEDKTARLRVPIYEEELKYFYANYKEYYYLPEEDLAIHKSVASFVDKEYRVQATAANCYTKKYSTYLPQWDVLISPFFKREYHSKEIFFEITDDIKQSRDVFSRYAEHVLHMIAYETK
ncbi:MAG: ribonuclease H-like domain-containing protein [Lachnospiraceae bacterium]|nr:ribonuclease H-like domain-containing protein [Lachnospiraceae bacterium]